MVVFKRFQRAHFKYKDKFWFSLNPIQIIITNNLTHKKWQLAVKIIRSYDISNTLDWLVYIKGYSYKTILFLNLIIQDHHL